MEYSELGTVTHSSLHLSPEKIISSNSSLKVRCAWAVSISPVRSQRVALPMFMKSDLYWQVMPKPKSLQKPVSFLITYRRGKKRKDKRAPKSEARLTCLVDLSSEQLQEEVQPQLWAHMNIFHGERMDLIGECYQLLLHRWDVFRASVDQSGVVLAEQHRVEHLFTWKPEGTGEPSQR